MQPVDAGTTDRVGFKATSTGGISMDDTITGDYAANEWTFTASGSGWKIGTDDGYITMSRNASSSSSYDAKFGTSGNVFTVGGSANAFTFTTTVSGTTVYFNKNESRSLINGYKITPLRSTSTVRPRAAQAPSATPRSMPHRLPTLRTARPM